MLWAGKLRLVNGDVADQIKPARANVGDFEQQVMAQRILEAGVVLMEVRRAHKTIKCIAGKSDALHNSGKLIL